MTTDEYAYTAIIPAYNAARTLRDAIESILAQTRPAARIIVVDDGSADDTTGIARALGAEVISQANQGTGAACNTGFAQVETPMVAYLDADDLWLPDKMERQFAAMAADPALDGVFGHLRSFHHGEPVDPDGPVRAGWIRTSMIARTASSRRVGPLYDPPAGGHGEMIDWISRARSLSLRFAMLDAIVGLRRIIPGSRTYDRSENERGYLNVARRALERRRAAQTMKDGV
jgi:glycosyltransferase involved in cell wall biosynthesis